MQLKPISQNFNIPSCSTNNFKAHFRHVFSLIRSVPTYHNSDYNSIAYIYWQDIFQCTEHSECMIWSLLPWLTNGTWTCSPPNCSGLGYIVVYILELLVSLLNLLWNPNLPYVPAAGHFKHQLVQYTAAITELLEQAVSIFSEKLQKREKSRMDEMHDEISDLICDLQNAAVDSNQSFRRVAVGPNDHFFLPSSSEYQNSREFGSMQQERKDRLPHRSTPCLSANSVLGQTLFDVCVPKNVEGWDIKFSGSLNGEPFASVRRRSPFRGMKHRSRLWELLRNRFLDLSSA